MNNSWQIEQLIKRAFIRTKERFLSYFLGIILGILSFIGLLIIYLITAFIVGLIGGFLSSFFLKSAPVVGIIAIIITIPVGVIGFILFLFVTSWIQLATTSILIQEAKLGAVETYKATKARVWGFVWFNFLASLFIVGLVPLGILSLGIILIIWTIWGSMAAFVYLQREKKGLANLWYSRALVMQKFWGIVWRSVVVYVALMILQFGLAFGTRDSAIAALGGISSGIISLFTGPFILSFLYEMYTNLTEPTEVKTPKVWVGLSIVGWVLSIILFVALSASAFMFIQNKAKDIQKLQMQMQKGDTNSYDYGSKL